MDNMTYLFAAVVLLAAVLASISIWAPRKLWIRSASIFATAGMIAVAYLGFSDLLSRPKPIHLEWAMRTVEEANLLGASAKEGEAIYVWLEIEGVAEPRAYKLPWNRKMAEQLQKATEDNQGNHTGVRVRSPFRAELDEDEEQPTFYSPPRRPPVEKASNGAGPLVFGDSR